MTSLRILHCLRAPVGGLFRHVCDLSQALAAMGHEVGVVCDASAAGPAAETRLTRLQDICALGVHRVPMSRQIGPRDFIATRAIGSLVDRLGPHVLHGHGAKGGAYARLAASRLRASTQPLSVFYTPHGGSLHYNAMSLVGRLYLTLERRLAPMTDGIIFESAYSARVYADKVAAPPCEYRVIPNGLYPHEFYEAAVDANAADFLFIGELRRIKGVDLLLQALMRLKRTHSVDALIVGEGPDAVEFKRRARRFGLNSVATFVPPMPARAAFARARCLVVPSRAESFPYIVLEAAAARVPIIATDVGGIPEIVEGSGIALLPCEDAAALREQMGAFLDNPDPFIGRARALQKIVSERYTVAGMAQAIVDFYADRIAARGAREPTPSKNLPSSNLRLTTPFAKLSQIPAI